MEGKGWFVIYGILALLVIGMGIRQLTLGSEVNTLKKQVAALSRQQPSPEPSASAPPELSAAPTPDLSTPAARDAVRKADLKATAEGLKKYKADKGSYPISRDPLAPDYLATVPADPLTPKYSYRYAKTATGFRLTAYLETKNDPDDAKDGKRDQTFTVTEASP